MHGRAILVGLFRGHPDSALYVVAEPDALKAIRLLKMRLPDDQNEFEDVGRVSEDLLSALSLLPGQFRQT